MYNICKMKAGNISSMFTYSYLCFRLQRFWFYYFGCIFNEQINFFIIDMSVYESPIRTSNFFAQLL